MERLTFEGNFCDIAKCDVISGGSYCESGSCTQRKVWERLKAYEDTGLSPQACAEAREAGKALSSCDISFGRLAELLTADKDGRLVVLPCKVGDVVYGFHGGKTILPMVAKWIETNTDGWCIEVQYAPMAPEFYRFSDFGKTVFFTQGEAEKALEAMEDD